MSLLADLCERYRCRYKPTLDELCAELVKRDVTARQRVVGEMSWRERRTHDRRSRQLGRHGDYAALLRGYYDIKNRQIVLTAEGFGEPPQGPPDLPQWTRPGARSRLSALADRALLCLGRRALPA